MWIFGPIALLFYIFCGEFLTAGSGADAISAGANNASDMTVYCCVAKTRSFSHAGELLGVTRSLVSKRISRLEKRLGTRLINRSTRSLSLTEAGELLYRRYSDINDRVERAEQEVLDVNKSHAGLIRLAAPVVCSYIGIPLISALQRQFPDIGVRLSVVDGGFDLIESGYDAAIHIGELKSSNLICRKITTARLAVCATPAYIALHGRPEKPGDLKTHNCLRHGQASGGGSNWMFRVRDSKAFAVQVSGNFSADNEIVLLRACLADIGICQLPHVLLESRINSGELALLLDEFNNISSDIYVVLPHRDVPEKVRIVIDFLSQQIKRHFSHPADD